VNEHWCLLCLVLHLPTVGGKQTCGQCLYNSSIPTTFQLSISDNCWSDMPVLRMWRKENVAHVCQSCSGIVYIVYIHYTRGARAPSGPGTPLSKLHCHTQINKLHSLGLRWTTNQPDVETSTWQHNTHKRQTFMPSVGLETAIPASEGPQIHALDERPLGSASCIDNLI